MKKVIKLTESQLTSLIKRVIREQGNTYMNTNTLDVNNFEKNMNKPSTVDWEAEKKKYVPSKEELNLEKIRKLNLVGKTYQLYNTPNYTEGNQEQMTNLIKITEIKLPLGMGSVLGYKLFLDDLGYKGSFPQKNTGGISGSKGFQSVTFTCEHPNELLVVYNSKEYRAENSQGITANYNKALTTIIRDTIC